MPKVYKNPLDQSNALAPESTRSKWNRYFKHIGDGNPRTVDKYNRLIEEIESELPFENEQEHQKWLDLGASWKGEDEWPQLTNKIISRIGFFGRPENSEEADDVLFALQAQYGNPKLTYEQARAKYNPDEVEEAVDYILKKKGYNKFTYFDGDPYGDGGK